MTAKVREALRSIYDQHGALTPKLVVEEARDKEHPLHHRFTWDDAEAGQRYRLVQAAELIRKVKITSRDLGSVELRAFIHIPRAADDDGNQGSSSYEPEEEVRADPAMQQLALAQMEREWRIFKRRWSAYKEHWQLFVAAEMQEAS